MAQPPTQHASKRPSCAQAYIRLHRETWDPSLAAFAVVHDLVAVAASTTAAAAAAAAVVVAVFVGYLPKSPHGLLLLLLVVLPQLLQLLLPSPPWNGSHKSPTYREAGVDSHICRTMVIRVCNHESGGFISGIRTARAE
ncbi:hypothetical protein LX36DRAFT_716241 [Colletotrichum falcatum]|nr:hypothetical protein LX36DRAFT_716241 [Colletotrichum falcatum]